MSNSVSQRDRLFSIFDKVQEIWTQHRTSWNFNRDDKNTEGDYWIRTMIDQNEHFHYHVHGGKSMRSWADYMLRQKKRINEFDSCRYKMSNLPSDIAEEDLKAATDQFLECRTLTNAEKEPQFEGFWKDFLAMLDAEGLDSKEYLQYFLQGYEKSPGTIQWFTADKLMMWLVWNSPDLSAKPGVFFVM